MLHPLSSSHIQHRPASDVENDIAHCQDHRRHPVSDFRFFERKTRNSSQRSCSAAIFELVQKVREGQERGSENLVFTDAVPEMQHRHWQARVYWLTI
jgi:hypothetical protein